MRDLLRFAAQGQTLLRLADQLLESIGDAFRISNRGEKTVGPVLDQRFGAEGF